MTSSFLFGTAQSWWGALPTLPVVAVLLVLGVGVFMADRVNKMPLALTYLGAFSGPFALTAYVGNPMGMQGVPFTGRERGAVLGALHAR